MSDPAQRLLVRWGAIIGFLSGMSGLFGAWIILPYRVAAVESEVRDVKRDARVDHDLIQRIDERTARMEKALDRLAK